MDKLFTVNSDISEIILDDYFEGIERCAEDYQEYPILFTELKKLVQANFSEIIELAFNSSLEKEEDRFHHFSFILFPAMERILVEDSYLVSESEPYIDISKENFYMFEKHQPLKKLTKLAPSLENTDRKFAVWLNENGEPIIWGFGELANFDSFDFIQIETFSFGKLVLTYFNRKYILSISKTEKINTEIRCFDKENNLTPVEIYKLDNPVDYGSTPKYLQISDLMNALNMSMTNSDETDWRYYKNFEELAIRMRKHCHGGTLLVSEEGWQNSIQEDIPFKAESTFQEVKNLMISETSQINQNNKENRELSEEEFYSDKRKVVSKSTIERKSKLLDFIAQLTAVDGATLVTKDFEIIAFGAKIKPINAEDKPTEILIREPFENSEENLIPLAELGGMRHQSAAQFVYDQKSSVAVVASQDGKLSVMFWNNKKGVVEVIQHAEYLFVSNLFAHNRFNL